MLLYLSFNIYSILTEIFFLFGIIVLLLFGVITTTNVNLGYPLLNKSIQFLVFQILSFGLILLANQSPIYLLTWNNLLIINSFSFYAKLVVICLGLIWLLSSITSVYNEKVYNFEFLILILLALLALLFILQVYDLLSAYLSIELVSLIFYILASLKRTSEFSTEAGIKYFILGAFSSSILLFGFALLYSITGLTNFNDLYLFFLQIDLFKSLYISNIIFLSLSLILIAFLFKLSAAPFHMWAPDVYEGSHSSITFFFSLMPKLAIFSLLLKFTLIIFYDLLNIWIYILFFSIVFSSIIGTFTAFNQTKWKRFVVYSSIGHLSFMLLAITCNDFFSVINLFMYLFIYLIMTIGFFSFFLNFYIFKFPFKYQVRYLNQLDYIITLNPLLSFTLGIILFSMAGIPPLAGFFAKFFVIFSAIKYKMFALIFLVLFCNCISCFYYIRLIKLIFFNNKIPKNFQVLPPVEKLNSYILGFVLFILILLFTDFEFVLLFTNLLSFSFI